MVDGDDTLSASDLSSTSLPSGSPRADVDTPPTVLVDRYQIHRRLGAGGMGVVYAARDIHLGRTVAVKLVSPRIDTGSGQGRLVREAQAMAKLRHPNIATIHDIGTSGDRLFVVMELIDGGTVADWMAAAPRSWRDVVEVYLQAGRGLAAAHAAGFVHRDFKPENLLVGKDGVARVSDFGVARIVGDSERAAVAEGGGDERNMTLSGVVVGTPGYIAPEILRREPEDERADQFSFCVAMLASLFGERPFVPLAGPNRTTETLGALRPLRGGVVPRWLLRILVRGLASDPRDRWPTMAALVAAIERRLGRRRRAAAIAVVAGFAVVAATVVAVRRSPPPPPPQWSPVVMGRTGAGSFVSMAVSPDGSTLASVSPTGAWVAPRVGAGARRHVDLPPNKVQLFRLSRTGDQFYYSIQGPRNAEIWAIDVATGRAERRVPTTAVPAVAPFLAFDVGADGEVLFVGAGRTTVWRAERTGAVRHVMTVDPGEWINEAVWSPDGKRIAVGIDSPGKSRIAVLDLASARVAVVSRRPWQTMEWLTDHSLVCAPMNFRRPRLIELLLSTDGGEAQERVRFDGPEFQSLDALYTSRAGVLFATTPFEHHLSILTLDAPDEARPIASGGVSDLPAAGWTTSGSLIFATSVQGQLRMMRRFPDGKVETIRMGPAAEVPLVVLGETIVFGRFPGGEHTIPFIEPPFGRKFPDGELFRLAPDGAVTSLGATRGFAAIVCAGGRAPPCLLHERSGENVIAVDWNVEDGARGPERARWNMKAYGGGGSLSADGRTLAQVGRFHGTGGLSLLDLESGRRRTIEAPETGFHFASFQPDGSLLAMAWKEGDIDLLRVHDAAAVEVVAVVGARGTTSFAADVQLAGDGKTAAVLMTGAPATYWWAAASQE